ncbi:MAG TPA: zf-HC2 domain-containing protein [Acidobacteriota bacterium]|nr:zf-HC2 domain-containing protein [Acidobacteriota bacterium]
MSEFYSCRDCVDLLMDYLEGNLEPEKQERLREHLSACAPCINFMKTYESCREMTSKLRDQKVEVPVEVQERLKSFLRDEVLTLQNQRGGRPTSSQG